MGKDALQTAFSSWRIDLQSVCFYLPHNYSTIGWKIFVLIYSMLHIKKDLPPAASMGSRVLFNSIFGNSTIKSQHLLGDTSSL